MVELSKRLTYRLPIYQPNIPPNTSLKCNFPTASKFINSSTSMKNFPPCTLQSCLDTSCHSKPNGIRRPGTRSNVTSKMLSAPPRGRRCYVCVWCWRWHFICFRILAWLIKETYSRKQDNFILVWVILLMSLFFCCWRCQKLLPKNLGFSKQPIKQTY